MKKEVRLVTLEELAELIKSQEDEFLIRVELGGAELGGEEIHGSEGRFST